MSESRQKQKQAGRFAYEGLDRALHEKARLGIMTSLMLSPDGLIFRDLKELCSLTDGNLSRHLQILSDSGLVEIWKGYKDRRPQTLCRLSKEGREKFVEYLHELERVLQDVGEAATETGRAGQSGKGAEPAQDIPSGWVPA